MNTLVYSAVNKRKEKKDIEISVTHIQGHAYRLVATDADYYLSLGNSRHVLAGEEMINIGGREDNGGVIASVNLLEICQVIVNKIGGTKKDRFTIKIPGTDLAQYKKQRV